MAKPSNSAVQLWVTGDENFRLIVKAKAAQAKMDMQDYIRKVLDVANRHDPSSFFAGNGYDHNHSETDKQP